MPARYQFPEWTNKLTKWVLLLFLGAPIYLIALVAYGVVPQAIRIGYQPTQPIPYSHALHVGELGIDCRYCHGPAEKSARAAIPTTSICLNCHQTIQPDSVNTRPLRRPKAIEWVRVHDLPDYVFFNHSAHVVRGVGCESCHGRIDQMEVVYQAMSLTMEFCLVCHNAPDKNLREPKDVTMMGYQAPGEPGALGRAIREANDINPPINCSTCHR